MQNNEPALHVQILPLNSALDCGRVCHSGRGGIGLRQMDRSADIDICRRTRTNGDEIRDLLSAAGFELQKVVATGPPLSLFAAKAHHQPRIRCDSYLAPGDHLRPSNYSGKLLQVAAHP